MAELIIKKQYRHTLETGVAFGISTLAICEALSRDSRQSDAKHYGIDPCQFSEHDGAAICLLRKYGFEKVFQLLEGPTHMMLPELIKSEERIEFAFIDGFHTFDYSLIDFFLIDKILIPGGCLAIHDLHLASKKKLLKFILGHRHYELLDVPELALDRRQQMRNLLRSLKHRDPNWLFQPSRGANLVLLKKTEDYEPEWHYFRNF